MKTKPRPKPWMKPEMMNGVLPITSVQLDISHKEAAAMVRPMRDRTSADRASRAGSAANRPSW
jgi:hypothetical protein